MLRPLLRWLGLTSLLFWAACSAEGTARVCTNADDCQPGQRCQSGTCFDACVALGDCGPTEYCGGGLCLDRPPCIERADCPTGFACDQRRCVPQQPECERDRDCPPRFTCDQGGCIPPGFDPSLECVTAADCRDAGARCVDNRCMQLDLPDAGPDPTDAHSEPRPDASTETDAVSPPPSDDVDPSDVSPIVDIVDDVRPPDTTPDASPVDTTDPPEVGPDVAPVVDTGADAPPEPACRFLTDCPLGFECEGGECVVQDPCEGRAPGAYTDRCTAAASCCNGLCLGNVAAGQGYCTQACGSWSDCNPLGIVTDDYFCADVGDQRLCARSDVGRTCASPDACIDGKCLQAPTRPGGASTSCTHGCRRGSDCGPGYACGAVPFNVSGVVRDLNVCVPVGGLCFGNETDCFSRVCVEDASFPSQYCGAWCDLRDDTACPTGWVCVDVGGRGVCARSGG